MWQRSFIAAVVLTVVGGGETSGQQPAETPASIPSVELPAELDRVLRDYESHWRAGEADALARLFVEDGLIVRQGTWIRGRPAIRDAYQSASGPLQLRAIEYSAGSRVGFIVGTYGYGERLPVDQTGMFVLTLRRDDPGAPWLIVSDLDRGAN